MHVDAAAKWECDITVLYLKYKNEGLSNILPLINKFTWKTEGEGDSSKVSICAELAVSKSGWARGWDAVVVLVLGDIVPSRSS